MLKQKLCPFLDALRTRKLTNRKVAQLLQVSEAHVSRTLKLLGVVKDPAPDGPAARAARKELVAARNAYRALVADTLPAKKAAIAANCCVRTIYRSRKK